MGGTLKHRENKQKFIQREKYTKEEYDVDLKIQKNI